MKSISRIVVPVALYLASTLLPALAQTKELTSTHVKCEETTTRWEEGALAELELRIDFTVENAVELEPVEKDGDVEIDFGQIRVIAPSTVFTFNDKGGLEVFDPTGIVVKINGEPIQTDSVKIEIMPTSGRGYSEDVDVRATPYVLPLASNCWAPSPGHEDTIVVSIGESAGSISEDDLGTAAQEFEAIADGSLPQDGNLIITDVKVGSTTTRYDEATRGTALNWRIGFVSDDEDIKPEEDGVMIILGDEKDQQLRIAIPPEAFDSTGHIVDKTDPQGLGIHAFLVDENGEVEILPSVVDAEVKHIDKLLFRASGSVEFLEVDGEHFPPVGLSGGIELTGFSGKWRELDLGAATEEFEFFPATK